MTYWVQECRLKTQISISKYNEVSSSIYTDRKTSLERLAEREISLNNCYYAVYYTRLNYTYIYVYGLSDIKNVDYHCTNYDVTNHKRYLNLIVVYFCCYCTHLSALFVYLSKFINVCVFTLYTLIVYIK